MPRRSRSASSTPNRTSGGRRAEPQRLQRLLAAAGFGSRRQCEELIEAGRVEVDGQTVTKLGTTVDPELHEVSVDGAPLKRQKLVYYAVNKPTGVVTTNRDPQGRPRVVDLVPPEPRVFPVGRLDRSSEGLILLTNDGDLAQRLAHPRFGVQKVYRVTVAGKVDPETMRQMRRGIYIAEGRVRVEGARILRTRSRATELEIVLREGKNREIRRILARLGHKVQQLKRIGIGPLRLGETPPAAYRPLTSQEVKKLHDAADAAEREGRSAGGAGQRRAGKPAGPRGGQRKTASSRKGAAGKNRSATAKSAGANRQGREIAADPDLAKRSTPGTVIGGEDAAAKPPGKNRAGKGRRPAKGKPPKGTRGRSGKAAKRSPKKRRR